MTTKEREDMISRIIQRNIEAGNHKGQLYPKIIHPGDEGEVRDLRANEIAMIREELQEGIDAIIAGDRVELLDAKCDVYVVCVGTIHKMGMKMNGHWREAEMDIANKAIDWYGLMDILDEVEKLTKLKKTNSRKQRIHNYLEYIAKVSYLLAREETDDVEGAINEVMNSNFSKFPLQKDENGKVTKNWKYKKPNLKKFLRQAT